MNDFDRNYSNPKLDDVRFNRKVKITAAIAMIIISAMIVLDVIGWFERWG